MLVCILEIKVYTAPAAPPFVMGAEKYIEGEPAE